ncbi:MAG: DUF898 domain-containing protein [Candidatus Aminicenantes bacterium]|nr:DUF898 domain-containing protein [Candidatus Aminicenantes bacterium]
MFKKELADVAKQTLFFLAVVLALPAALILLKVSREPYLAVLMPVFQGGLLFWSLFLGASLFGRERRERAMEYALTLPYSRAALLGRLVAARAVVLLALWILSWVAYAGWGSSYSAFPPPALALFYFPLFIISVSLAPLIENFIALCLVSLAAWYVTIPASHLLMLAVVRAKGLYFPWDVAKRIPWRGFDAVPAEFAAVFTIFSLVLPVVPFAAALVLSFRKFDIRPSAAFVKRYLAAFAVLLGGGVLAGFLAASAVTPTSAYRGFYVASGQKIIEFQPYRVNIHRPGGVIPVKHSLSWWRVLEAGPYFYARDEENNLVRLNTEDGTTKMIFRAQKEDRHLWQQWAYGGEIALFSRSASPPPSSLSLVVMDSEAPEGQKPQVIPCRHAFFETEGRLPAVPYLFGAGLRDGRAFWLIGFFARDRGPLRLWENGHVEELFPGESCPVQRVWFVNDMLLRVDKDSLRIYQEAGSGEGYRLVKSIPESFSFSSWDFISRELDPAPVRAVYGKRLDKIARLDLETLELMDIAPLRAAVGALVVAYFPERFYLQETGKEGESTRISAVGEGGMTLLREFKNFDIGKRGYSLDYQPGGIIAIRPNKVEMYAFPDLKELRD